MNKFLWLMIFILVALITEQIFNNGNILEGFNDFSECLNKGFTKEFCVQTPVSFSSPTMCRCENGTIGQTIPGWIGQCICPAMINPILASWL